MPFFFVDRDARHHGPARSLLASASNGLAACWQGREAFASAGQATPVFGATGALTNRVKTLADLPSMMAAIGPRQEGRFPQFFRPKKAKKSAPPPPLRGGPRAARS